MKKSKILIMTKRILISLAIILCATLIFVAGWLCFDRFVNKSKVPSFIGYASLTVATGSMSGTIEEGDFIIIKKTGNYKIGDIITFIHPGEKIPTTHRIIQKNSDGSFITKGDANNSQDIRVVTQNEIFGEVVSVWHGFGIFIGWFTSGGGFIYVLSLVLIIGMSVYVLKKSKPEKQFGNCQIGNDSFTTEIDINKESKNHISKKEYDNKTKTKGNNNE